MAGAFYPSKALGGIAFSPPSDDLRARWQSSAFDMPRMAPRRVRHSHLQSIS
jgi:hypothetical protein